MEIANYQDYRKYLKDRLEYKMGMNPMYSLRAFARDLAISPQALSHILNGKRKISIERAASIAEKLDLSFAEASVFLDLVTIAHSQNLTARSVAQFRLEQDGAKSHFQPLDVEVFKIISDWHHYAILELTETSDFLNDVKWIASRLGISTLEAQQAVDRLMKLELLEINKNGHLQKTDLNISTTRNIPSAAVRKFTQQILAKASESLELQSVEERDFSTITMAIDPALLPEAQRMIRSFRRKLCRTLEQGKRSEVYTMSLSLFRLTQKKKKEKVKL